MEQEKEHVFSEKFEERQRMMIERVREEERSSNNMRKNNKKWAAVAAVALLVIGGSVTAAERSGLFKVEDIVIEETKQEGNTEIAFGLPESNEWKGAQEWSMFFWDYFEKDEYIDACNKIDENLAKGIEDNTFSQYPKSYNIHTQKMADKLEEILKKYDLKLEGEEVIVDSYEKLLSQMKIEDFVTEDIYMPFAVTCEGGNWHGDFALGGNDLSDWKNEDDFSYSSIVVSHKGVLDSLMSLNMGDISNCEEWNYVNTNGDSLLLMTNSEEDRSYIFYEGAQDFIIIRLDSKLLKEQLQKTSDAFEFSKISKAN